MSEHIHKGHEQFSATPEASHEAHHHKAAPEHEPRYEKQETASLPQLEKLAKDEAVAGKELVSYESKGGAEQPLYVNSELKEQSWRRSLTRTRKQLSLPSRAFSKVIHQPVVDSLSQAGEKTIARPSGLLFGGICAFLGSSFFLYMAKHYGFTYNYLFFFLFFAGGFAIGLVLEALASLFSRNKA